MNILVINCGSSSLKFQLIDSESEKVLAKGNCERIGIDGRLVYTPAGGTKEITEYVAAVNSYMDAAQKYIDAATDDLNLIVEQRNKAIQNANKIIEEYNAFFEKHKAK